MRFQSAFSQVPFIRVLALGGLLSAAAGPASATDVGVSISVGQPGFYGTIDIGNYPRPQVIYTEPRVIRRPRVLPAPVYLRIPPGHEKHWDKHCDEYRACDRPVYFVQDRWYQDTYVPAYRERQRVIYTEKNVERNTYIQNNNYQGNDNDQGKGNYKGGGPGNSGNAPGQNKDKGKGK